MDKVILSPTDFVGVLNQTLEYAYPNVVIVGELANFRVSKNRWVYFDLKDEYSSVKFFGTVYQLPGPLEDGLMLQVRGNPRLHPQYGFSITVQSMQPVGEGSLKRAAALLEAKMRAEGLFDDSRKRSLPRPPQRVGLITSSESAAYADFIKILNQRWGGLDIELADVQVQGEAAVEQIVRAIEQFNAQALPPEVLVITRGGGSAEDLAAFSTEQVTRAVAASRIPTLVAIGHEVDLSLAELAADQRASTPSNAAELLVPDKTHELQVLQDYSKSLSVALQNITTHLRQLIETSSQQLNQRTQERLMAIRQKLAAEQQLLEFINPQRVLRRGYALVKTADGTFVTDSVRVHAGEKVSVLLHTRELRATIESVKNRGKRG